MTDTKDSQDILKALEKFSKQLHMYTPDQLRNSLKTTIGMAKKAIEDSVSCEAIISGLETDTCMVVFPKDNEFRALPGDDMEIEVPCMDEGLKVYNAKVATVMGSTGEICCLRDIRCVQHLERRGAQRIPMHINAEYCYQKDEHVREAIEPGEILNVSKTGLLMSSPVQIGLGNDLSIRFELGWDNIWEDIIKVPVVVIGTVVREQENGSKTYPGEHKYSYGVKINLLRRAV